MSRTDPFASDPSVADYRATSPRFAQGGKLMGDSPYSSERPVLTCDPS